MNSYISLRDRRFDVTSAVVRQFDGLWSVEIKTEPKEFDGEMWSPRLYHQGLRLLTHTEDNPEGASTSWRNKSDATYPHPELGLMYVFGHHDVYDTTLAFGRMDAGHIELAWDGLCDVFWSGDFTEAVPFQCRCVASVRHG
ncbi:hypothetical protein [Variovorax paradoxus]|uniref:hypothetical protein n=1 Tax=Variovorax paradoxus TaxID=34073 RepID=UPI00278192BE|nr:hypothetical protein [Variovorax paradoxus]MDQ0586385.1 hypothetical protein [Variovorax paradoxus]